MAEHIDRDKSVYDPRHDEIRAMVPSMYVCPSTGALAGVSSYAGIHHDVEAPIDADNHGLLYLNSHIQADDIVDGRAFTLLVGEKRTMVGEFDLGWMSGTRATLRNTGTPLNATPQFSQLGPPLPEGTAANADGEPVQSVAAGQPPAVANNTPPWLVVGGLGSQHPGVTGLGFADGHIQFVGNSIDQDLMQRLGHRGDGKLVNPAEVE